MEGMMGVPIEHIAVESRRREVRRFYERQLPPQVFRVMEGRGGLKDGKDLKISPEEKKELIETMRSIGRFSLDIGIVYGYGEMRMGPLWDTDASFPWRTCITREPYSVIFMAADVLGTIEAYESTDMRVLYDEIEKDVYHIETYPGSHPLELKERLGRKRYQFKPGDIQYDGCEECGIPMPITNRIWDTDKGTIVNPDTGRRMAIFGPMPVDSLFDDLEEEIGEIISETIIEAQRRQIKTSWSTERWIREGSTFQEMIALRGLGNLVTFEGDRNHLDIVVENACLHLPMVGTVQALVELAYNAQSCTCDWELSDDGDLSMTFSNFR
jgi:hypothetical protein